MLKNFLFVLFCCTAKGQAPTEPVTIAMTPEPEMTSDRMVSTNGVAEETYTLSDNQIAQFVDGHNRQRRDVDPSASNMLLMSWDVELANIAAEYSGRCLFRSNLDINHSRFSSVGENILLTQNIAYNENFPTVAVESFSDTKPFYNYTTRECSHAEEACSRYTQVVWADTFKLGCGITRCGTITVNGVVRRGATITVCNYGPRGNWINNDPYERGQPCSGCHFSDTCDSGLCANPARDVAPPTDIEWFPWQPWSQCSATCGFASQRRMRICNSFIPAECTGSQSQISFFCAESSICPPGNATWSSWTLWSDCSVSCGRGEMARTRTCSSGNNRHCTGSARMVTRCNVHDCPASTPAVMSTQSSRISSTQSVTVSVAPSRGDGDWTRWANFGPCSHTCGSGRQVMTRTCRMGNCVGDSARFGDCSMRRCPPSRAILPGTWGPWGDFTECSKSCGGGLLHRFRQCSPLMRCCGETHSTRTCSTRPCRQPTWSIWSVWLGSGNPDEQTAQVRSRYCRGGGPEECYPTNA